MLPNNNDCCKQEPSKTSNRLKSLKFSYRQKPSRSKGLTHLLKVDLIMRGRKPRKPVTQAEIFHSSSEEAYFDTKEVKKLPQIKDFALNQNQYLMIMSKLPKMFSLQPVKYIQKSRKLLSEIIDKPSQREDSQKKQQQKQKKNMIRRETSKMTINSNQSWEIDEQPSIITYSGLEPGRSEQQKLAYYDLQKSNQEQQPSLPHNEVINTISVAVPQNQYQNIPEFQKQVQLNPIQQIQQAEPYKKQERHQGETENMQQILNVKSKRGRKSRLKSIDAASRQFNESTSREHKSKQKQFPPQTVWTTREQQAYRQKFAQEYHILKALKQHPHIQPFMLPVDEVKDGAPGYLTIIKKPMDLSTIENKLKNHVYENCNQFHSDVEQMWENSHIYNRPKSAMTKLTFQLQKTYKNLKQVYGNKKEGNQNKRVRRI